MKSIAARPTARGALRGTPSAARARRPSRPSAASSHDACASGRRATPLGRLTSSSRRPSTCPRRSSPGRPRRVRGFLPASSSSASRSPCGAAAVAAAGAAAGVASPRLPRAAVAGARRGRRESAQRQAAAAAAGGAARRAALFAPQLAAEHDAWPAAAVAAAEARLRPRVAGVCGAGAAPPHPMRAPAPSAASVPAKSLDGEIRSHEETPF